MSRSVKKHPFAGMTTCRSEKDDKRFAHRRFRQAVRSFLFNDPEEDTSMVPVIREVSNVFLFGKDGRMSLTLAEALEWYAGDYDHRRTICTESEARKIHRGIVGK